MVAAVGVLVAGVVLSRSMTEEQVTPEAPRVEKAGAAGPMTEEERLAYLESSVRVRDMAVRATKKPDSEEVVPGLLEVTGVLENQGDRPLEKAVVVVYPKDAAGEVIGGHYENVIIRGALQPGESRNFRFAIPDKKEFGGEFTHGLR